MTQERQSRMAHSSQKSFGAGAISGAVSTTLFQPFDLVKTRMQMHTISLLRLRSCVPAMAVLNPAGPGTFQAIQLRTTPGLLNTIGTVIDREGTLALWKGLNPSLQRCVPSIGVYFAALTHLKNTVSTDGKVNAVQSLCIGGIARGIAASTVIPFTVIKTRFESGSYSYDSVHNALRSIWRTEGLRGLYGGLGATVARDAPFSAIYYMVYSQTTQIFKKDSSQVNTFYVLPCGVFAGLIAAVTTQPFDVVKTRKQVANSSYRGLFPSLVAIVMQEGVGELYRGLLPRVLRRTFMAAFTWTFYEEIQYYLSKNFN